METGQVAPSPQPQASPSAPPGTAVAATAAGSDQAFNAILQQTVGQQAEDTATTTTAAASQNVDAQLLAKLLEQVTKPGQLVQADTHAEGDPQANREDGDGERHDQTSADQTQAAQLLASYLQAAMRPTTVPTATPQQPVTGTDAQALTTVSALEQTAQIATAPMQPVGVSLGAAHGGDLPQLKAEATGAEEMTGRALLAQADVVPSDLKQEVQSEQVKQPVKVEPAAVQPKLTPVVSPSQAEPAASKAVENVVPSVAENAVQAEQVAAPAVTAAAQQAANVQSDEKAAVFEGVTVQKTTTTAVAPTKFAQHPDVQALVSHQAQAGENSGRQADQQPADSGQQALPSKLLSATGAETGEQQSPPANTVSMPQQMDHALNGLHLHRQEAARELATEPQVATSGDQVGRQVAERLSNHTFKQGNDQITLKLSPEHLGNLQLNVRMDEQRLRIEVVAEQRGVRDALLQQVDELKETLARRNITMDSFDVTTSSNGGMNQQTSDWRQTASERRPQTMPYYASTKSTSVSGVSTTDQVRYFAPQYQSTLDVRF